MFEGIKVLKNLKKKFIIGFKNLNARVKRKKEPAGLATKAQRPRSEWRSVTDSPMRIIRLAKRDRQEEQGGSEKMHKTWESVRFHTRANAKNRDLRMNHSIEFDWTNFDCLKMRTFEVSDFRLFWFSLFLALRVFITDLYCYEFQYRRYNTVLSVPNVW